MVIFGEETQVERWRMSRKMWIFFLLSCLLLLSSACTVKSVSELPAADDDMGDDAEIAVETEPVVENTLTEMPEPTQTTAPTPTLRTILWEDDFSDVTSGWERYHEFDGVLDYEEEQEVYQMQVLADDSIWWVYQDESLTDVGMSADVWQVGGPEGTLYGLMCRYDANIQGYVFMINTEGQAGVGIIGDNFSFEPIPGGELTNFDVIQTGLNVKNNLDAVCMGDALLMVINGELIFDIPATGLTGDDIGLVVATPMGAGVDVYFDNLVMYAP